MKSTGRLLSEMTVRWSPIDFRKNVAGANSFAHSFIINVEIIGQGLGQAVGGRAK